MSRFWLAIVLAVGCSGTPQHPGIPLQLPETPLSLAVGPGQVALRYPGRVELWTYHPEGWAKRQVCQVPTEGIALVSRQMVATTAQGIAPLDAKCAPGASLAPPGDRLIAAGEEAHVYLRGSHLLYQGAPFRAAAEATGGFQSLGRLHLLVVNPFWASLCSYVLQRGDLQDRGCSRLPAMEPGAVPADLDEDGQAEILDPTAYGGSLLAAGYLQGFGLDLLVLNGTTLQPILSAEGE